MNFHVEYQSARRIRLSFTFPCNEGVNRYLQEELYKRPEVVRCHFYKASNAVEIFYQGSRKPIFSALSQLSMDKIKANYLLGTSEEKPVTVMNIIAENFLQRSLLQLVLPAPIRTALTLFHFLPYVKKAAKSLVNRQLSIDLLDFVAIGSSLAMKDFSGGSSIMFLLNLSGKLESWAEKKALEDLESSLTNQLETVWLLKDGELSEIKSELIEKGDIVRVSTGNGIPFDGKIIRGKGMVNEASMTGESFPVFKKAADTVFSSTILENGELDIQVENTMKNSRIKQIIRLIQESDEVKSAKQTHLTSKADQLVKYNFLGMFLTYALTRSWNKTLSFLLVDFSCALKLSTPITYLTAMKDASNQGIVIKGSKYIEEFKDIDTFVFDKTGTLTTDTPKVIKTIPFFQYSKEEVIRIAACLEEHHYHPIAAAVVQKAVDENIQHDEMHGDLKYIVSKGIISSIDEKRVVVGSEYFVLHEEKVVTTFEQQEVVKTYGDDYNLLYLGYDGRLIAIFCIDAPIRPEVPTFLASLKQAGKKIVLLTGDKENRAKKFAKHFDFDEILSEVTPEEKYQYIVKEQSTGHKVLMAGDGINDSVALSSADIAVVLKNSSDLARQVSDVILLSDNLNSISEAITLSKLLNQRMQKNLYGIIGVNSGLIGTGLFGILSSKSISLFHNMSTLGIVLSDMRPFKLEKPINPLSIKQ